MAYTPVKIDQAVQPKPTKFLNLRPMCGGCHYKCCHQQSMTVDCTPEEQKKLGLPAEFPIAGHCRCLTPTGCTHGEDRPVQCKLFPVSFKANPGGAPWAQVPHWVLLNCPMTHDYHLEKVEDGKYHYRRRANICGQKKNNSEEVLVLDMPIEKRFPTALEGCREGVDLIYGPDATDRILEKLKPKEGFGL